MTGGHDRRPRDRMDPRTGRQHIGKYSKPRAVREFITGGQDRRSRN